MRRLIILLITFFYILTANCQSSVSLEYTTPFGEKLNLHNGDYYDIEHKPTFFTLNYSNNNLKEYKLLIDIFRKISNDKIDNQKNTNYHYYKTIILTSEEPQKIDIQDMFHTNKSRFIETSGFKLSVCCIEPFKFIKTNNIKDCDDFFEIEIIYGD